MKENDCNYASLFLNFAVHLPRLLLVVMLLVLVDVVVVGPTILAWEAVEDLDTELDPQDKTSMLLAWLGCCSGL